MLLWYFIVVNVRFSNRYSLKDTFPKKNGESGHYGKITGRSSYNSIWQRLMFRMNNGCRVRYNCLIYLNQKPLENNILDPC